MSQAAESGVKEAGSFGGLETNLVEIIDERQGGFATGAERALMSALLFDGVQAFLNYACAGTKAQRKRYQEAFTWVKTRGGEYIFSFDNVCEGLGIDPDFLRCGLINTVTSESQKWKKMRRNF